MDDLIDRLFEPFRHKSLNLRNRIVMSPMTRYFSPDGMATEGVATYYERRALGGAGLIISEGVFLDRPISYNVETVPRFFGDYLEPWRRVIDTVHAAGAAMGPQFWHVGGSRDFNFPDSELGRWLESPSGIATSPDGFYPLDGAGTVMTEEDIADVAAAFVKAAVDAKALGFDCVEFHGAHGYLFDQFFWSATNNRTDRYGGTTLAERTRFATEVISAVRKAVGPYFALIFRMSQWKTYFYDVKLADSPGQLEAWLRPLVDAGVDIFDCSQRRFWEAEFQGSDLNLAGWVKKLSGQPTMTVGSIGLSTDLHADFATGQMSDPTPTSIREVAERLDRGEFDLVAIGRSLLADPDWVEKVRHRRFADLRGYSIEAMKTLY